MKKVILPVILLFLFFGHLHLTAQNGHNGQNGSRLISFSDLAGFLVLNYQVTGEKSYVNENLINDISRGFLEGGIQIFSKGAIYHPNLLTFNIDANIVGNRAKTAVFSDAEINNSINNSYNIRMLFLKKKNLNIELYTQSSYITAERRFLGRFFTDHKVSGINITASSLRFPFKLLVYRMRNSTQGLAFFEREEKSSDIDFKVTLLKTKKSGSFLTFKQKNYSEAVYDVDYNSLEFMADLRHYYGINSASNVIALGSYNKMSGNYNFDIFRFFLNNRHYLRKKLYLRGDYDLIKDDTEGRASSKQKGQVALHHRLFESLESEVFVGGRLEDSIYQERDVFSRGFSFAYRKTIPTGAINMSYTRSDENSRFTSHSDIVSTSEIYKFSFSDTITVTKYGIDPAAITLTDTRFSQVYIPDVDYQVNVIDHALIITRLPGGNIPEKARVVVYFSYLAYPDFDMDSAIYNLNAQVLFLKYFKVYYHKSSMQHKISSQFLVAPFESYDRDILGAKLDSRLIRLEYSVEKRDSNLSSGHEGWHFKASASYRLFRGFSISGYLSRNYMKYLTGDYYTRFNTATVNLSYNPSPSLTARAMYRMISFETPDYLRSRTSVLVKLQWNIRRLMLEFLYEHILEGYDISERLHDYFALMIRRRF